MEEYASSFNSLMYASEVHRDDLHCLRANVVDLEDRPRCTHKYYPHIFLASAPCKKRGVLISIKESIAFKAKDAILDLQGRFIILLIFTHNPSHWPTFMHQTPINSASFVRPYTKSGKFNMVGFPSVDIHTYIYIYKIFK